VAVECAMAAARWSRGDGNGIHIPLYIVVMLGGLCGVLAYRRTCSVRRSPHLP
jgi:hypothetical protein